MAEKKQRRKVCAVIYEYECCDCNTKVDIIKSIREFERQERCKLCGALMTRCFSARIQFTNTAVQELQFNPALGRAVTRREMAQIAKDKGWVEVGNEKVEKHVAPKEIEYPTFTNDDIDAIARKQ